MFVQRKKRLLILSSIVLGCLLVTYALAGAAFGGVVDGSLMRAEALQTEPPLGSTADWEIIGPNSNSQYGLNMETIGDINGDGYADFVHIRQINAVLDIFCGGSSGLPSTPCWTINTPYPGSSTNAKYIGDVNSDGYDDFMLSDSTYDNTYTNEGIIKIYYGSSTGPAASPDWTREGGRAGAGNHLISSTGVGDYDGDGYDDFLFIDYGFDKGKAQLYLGGNTGLATSPATEVLGQPNNYNRLGVQSGALGDINGDGHDDFALLEVSTNTSISYVRVYYGQVAPAFDTPNWSWSTQSVSQIFPLVGADVNNDGYDDLVSGHFQYSNGQNQEGQIFAFYGSGTGLASQPDWSYESDIASYNIGSKVDSAGDVNGDGFEDIIFSPYSLSNPNSAYVILGSASGLESSPTWSIARQTGVSSYNEEFSYGIGDVNGDGADDVAVGFSRYDVIPGSPHQFYGRVRVFYGTPTIPDPIEGLAIVRSGNILTATHTAGGELTYIWQYGAQSITCPENSAQSVTPVCSSAMLVGVTATNGTYTETVTGVFTATLGLDNQ